MMYMVNSFVQSRIRSIGVLVGRNEESRQVAYRKSRIVNALVKSMNTAYNYTLKMLKSFYIQLVKHLK